MSRFQVACTTAAPSASSVADNMARESYDAPVTIDPAVASDAEPYMRLAITEARRAEAEGDLPIGAVAVRNGEVIATGYNRRAIDQDPTAHAEMLVLREAADVVGDWRL